jgi:DNA-binding transcriptional ArsR family regulator
VEANVLRPEAPEASLSRLLTTIGQPARVQILVALTAQEACVCHLEAVTGMRQASISQHLMVLRKAGLVTPNRAGRNIFYRVSDPETVQAFIRQAASMAGVDMETLAFLARRPVEHCPCPQCNPGSDPERSCSPLHHQPGKRQR